MNHHPVRSSPVRANARTREDRSLSVGCSPNPPQMPRPVAGVFRFGDPVSDHWVPTRYSHQMPPARFLIFGGVCSYVCLFPPEIPARIFYTGRTWLNIKIKIRSKFRFRFLPPFLKIRSISSLIKKYILTLFWCFALESFFFLRGNFFYLFQRFGPNITPRFFALINIGRPYPPLQQDYTVCKINTCHTKFALKV